MVIPKTYFSQDLRFNNGSYKEVFLLKKKNPIVQSVHISEEYVTSTFMVKKKLSKKQA
jgi:hypothetical protein